MRVVTLGSLGAVAPIAAPQPGVYGLGAMTTSMTAQRVMLFSAGVAVGAITVGFFLRRKRR